MANGYIIVRVSTAGGTIPLENAMVTIYNATDLESGIVAVRYTNQSGKTDKIPLNAPPRSLSESPDNGGVRPYSVYNVEVTSEGYYDSFNLEVPIFDGVTSILPVSLIPLSGYNSNEVVPDIGIDVVDREPPLSNGGEF